MCIRILFALTAKNMENDAIFCAFMENREKMVVQFLECLIIQYL